MNDHLIELARKTGFLLCLAVSCGGFTACTDDYDLDDEGNYPATLGGSVYEALSNPVKAGGGKLSGTFQNYLRLIDDLGYAETLNKTGSMTVFPANDEAFARFYESNHWGVSSYEGLTDAMKRQLLKGSMLKNALLVEMFSNISNGSTAVTQGQALKHVTNQDITDDITLMRTKDDMPQNNSYWEKFYDTGLYLVKDATTPMMIHFTEEQMTANNITTRGEMSDFEVITGTPYDADEHSAYIFRNKIIAPDVTCKNGYIHQMEDVLVPPGNMAEVIRTNGESNLFSRMLDRFCAPYEASQVTRNYNDNAVQQGLPQIENIYQLRYMSKRSADTQTQKDPNSTNAPYQLRYDPGWNEYNNGTGENTSKDIAAMFVPTDEALWKFFKPGGRGEFLINQFGTKPNTYENLAENIDSIPLQNVGQIIDNLMQSSFVGSVPSKFNTVMNDASDPMGMTLDSLNRNANGSYDVKIANNGVIYMLSSMFAPTKLIAVSAPTLLSDDMHVMGEAIYDGDQHTALGYNQNYYAYLLAMSANYALFIPTDDAFQNYYVDPTTLGTTKPRALKFYYKEKSPYLYCSSWNYNPETGEVGDSIEEVSKDKFKTQIIDILNYHTVVLPNGRTIGDNGNRYYKTKHGGEIDLKKVMPLVTKTYNQENGNAYAITHVIEAPSQSVLSVLQDDRFSEFLALCSDFDMDELMDFASDKLASETPFSTTKNRKYYRDAYHTFADKHGLTDNVNYFNSYNYTVYAPDNEAMQKAYNLGLPRWSDIKAIYDTYTEEQKENKEFRQEDRDKALAMVEEINAFIRYHFQDNAVYADKEVEAGSYPTACSDTLGIREKLIVTGGNDRLYVQDKNGQKIEINAENSTKLSNQMTRDYVFNMSTGDNPTPTSISTSSFAVVHQISTPFSTHTNTSRYDNLWRGEGARQRLAAFRKLFEDHLYKRY